MVRAVRSVSLPKDLDDVVENNFKEKGKFSEYVQNCLIRDFMDREQVNKKIKEHEDAIGELKKFNPLNKEKGSEKEKFFRVAREKIKENPNFLLGQWEKYKNLFEKISLEKFQEIINEQK